MSHSVVIPGVLAVTSVSVSHYEKYNTLALNTMSLKMHVREYQINYIIILVQFLLIATVECTNLLRSSFKYNKGLYPSTGPLDYQPGLSLEDCVSLCWEEDGCKSVNYHRHATLCELNRVDSADFASTDFKEDTGSIYSEKRSWAEVLFIFFLSIAHLSRYALNVSLYHTYMYAPTSVCRPSVVC